MKDAIEAYDLALEVHTREALPQHWARVLRNKGNVLLYLGECLVGDARVDALRNAIEAYNLALEVYTKRDFPYYHDLVEASLGRALQLLDK